MNFPFQTLNTPDSFLNRVQDNVARAFNSLVGPFLGGKLLTGISLTASAPLAINHGLGRQPQLWVLCDQNANTTVWRTAWNQNSITLEAAANCTVSIWVN